MVYQSPELWETMQRVAELEQTVNTATRPFRTLDATINTVRVPKEIYDAAQMAHQARAVAAEFESAVQPVINILTQLGHEQAISVPVIGATAGGTYIESQDISIFVPRSSHPPSRTTTTDGQTDLSTRLKLHNVQRPVLNIETVRALVITALDAYDDDWTVSFAADVGALIVTTMLGFLFLPVGIAVGFLYVIITTYGTAQL